MSGCPMARKIDADRVSNHVE